ncbi:MAG: nucleoside/nucleotide kinase family protein [Pseudorhodobacter sp.]|nr:nucleoside/nucleotide kinase family protein [Pseudorhodobacter sp.]
MITLAGLADVVAARAEVGRVIVALAGAPGSGKSTVAAALAELLNAGRPGVAAVLAMDGYHYDDLLLVPQGKRARKGAPDTFDVAGLRHVLGRLRAADEAAVAVPVFDRSIEIARAGARLIGRDVRIIIVEGNWLLLGQEPWSGLRPLFDLTVLIEVPEVILRQRLTARWQGYGLTPDQIAQKLEGNDLPNARLVAAQSTAPDFRLQT